MINERFYTTLVTVTVTVTMLHLLLLYSYYDSVTGGPLLGPPFWAPSWASLGITWYGPTWTI